MSAAFEMEVGESVVLPFFEATRDVFAEAIERRFLNGQRSRVRKSQLVVSSAAHDTARHFAMTNTETLKVVVAPEMADLEERTILGILAHELGHVSDFAYPGAFSWPRNGSGTSDWVGQAQADKARAWRHVFGKPDARSGHKNDDHNPATNWMVAWESRSSDQIEWAADAITYLVTGKRIGYAGPCLLQSVGSGIRRPKGLR